MSKEKFMNDHNAQLHLKREERLKDLLEIIINSPNGMSAKEMGAALKTSADSARLYIKDLLERNLIAVSHQEGKTRIYKAVDPATVKPIEEQPVQEVEAPKEDLMPVGHSSKEFEPGSYIPCGDSCRPGDVVWVSSRSGEGAFFRYLVITPWEYKAMVLGIFEEGHPKLNVNDPYYVYIGDDPEKGVRLYADLRNTCQRGYRQFGEKVMHVNQDLFDDVKARLARSMGFEPCKDKSIIIERYKGALKKCEERCAHKDKEIETLKAKNELLKKERDIVAEKLQQEKELYGKLYKEYTVISTTADELKKSNAELEKKLKETQSKPQIVDSDVVTGMLIDSEVKKTKIEVYEEEIKMLRQMVFSMIKGGASQ